jgi:hypothetical protein
VRTSEVDYLGVEVNLGAFDDRLLGGDGFDQFAIDRDVAVLVHENPDQADDEQINSSLTPLIRTTRDKSARGGGRWGWLYRIFQIDSRLNALASRKC